MLRDRACRTTASARQGESVSLGEQIKAAQASMATWPEIPERHPAEPGMSLWDYFAAHAPLPNAEALDCLRGNSVLTAHVMWACHYADAMMTERARRVSEGVSRT